MINRILLIFSSFALFACLPSFSQIHRCGVQKVDIRSLDIQQFAQVSQSYVGKVNGTVRVIPVVFHVISERLTDPANISQNQITSAITVLNEAFRGVYGGVDCEIEFCLAGVNRVQHPIHSIVQLRLNDDLAKALSQEDPNTYINIWTVEELYDDFGRQIGGFTIYPKFLTTFPQSDGVLIDHRFVGNTGTATNNGNFDLGRGLVHEVGHWLNIFHVFEGGCDDSWTCATMGDCCCDTPPQLKEHDGCKKRKNTCKTDNPDLKDPVQNFMGYSDDDCRVEFTACQAARMHLTLDSIRRTAWFVQGGDCPVLRLANPAFVSEEPQVAVFPNPIQEASQVRIDMPRKAQVSVVMFDGIGRVVGQLQASTMLDAGMHFVSFPGGLAAGQYYLRVQVGSYLLTTAVQVL